MTIDMLPDNALVEIFDFYLDGARTEAWITLVHVSQKWRSVVFGSPRRLNLRLDCRARTPVRETLDVWPAHLPILISGNDDGDWEEEEYCGHGHGHGLDNILAALEQHNERVSGVELWTCQMANVLAAMRDQPFPALTYLDLASKPKKDDRTPSHRVPVVVPDSFLGGSAPRLRSLSLDRIPFPGLPSLLLSATQLVSLSLCGVPFRLHLARGDRRWPLRLDQAQITLA